MLESFVDTTLDRVTGGLWTTVEEGLFKGKSMSTYGGREPTSRNNQPNDEGNNNNRDEQNFLPDGEQASNKLTFGDFEITNPQVILQPLIWLTAFITVGYFIMKK